MDDVERTIEAVWRIESPRLIARLTRMVGDVGVAEELAQDALVAALERWPESGVPDNPGAWLMATGKHKAIDVLRRRSVLERKYAEVAREVETEAARDDARSDLDAAVDGEIGDDLLRLMFTACHPVLSTEARVALTLRLLGGLTTEEIARAFLVPAATIAQRIVRAKRTLAAAQVPFEVPEGPALAARLTSVLEVLYLVFNEGYAATAGDDWMRPDLCFDALRLGRVLAELMPDAAEVHGLVALMEIQASRSRARVGPSGEPVLLFDQDRSRWDQVLVRRGLDALERAERVNSPRGPYWLQGSIAACHARAAPPKRRTGSVSLRCTTRSSSSRHRRSSSSIEPSRSGWLSAPRSVSSWSTGWWPTDRSPRTTCSPACAVTSSRSSGASTGQQPSSPPPRRRPGTLASGCCCWSEPPRAPRRTRAPSSGETPGDAYLSARAHPVGEPDLLAAPRISDQTAARRPIRNGECPR